MTRADGYPTPDTPGTITYTTRCVTMPDIPEFINLIGGLLFQATRPSFWMLSGDMTPDEAAILVQDALALYDATEVCNVDTTPVGNMMIIPHDTVPDKWLLCHGTTVYDRVDYPDLYALLTEFQIDADTFNLPNMSSRFPYGYLSSGEPVGTEGGQAQATLSLTNVPPHTHTMAHTHGLKASNASGGSFGATGAANVNAVNSTHQTQAVSTPDTGSSGGSGGVVQAFAIVNPYVRMKYIIKALP